MFNINYDSFITSDSHFGHFNIRKYEPIRLKTSQELGYEDDVEKMLEDLWNKKVSDTDTVLHLGDLFFKGKFSTYEIENLNKLNGNKILLIGNHDRPKYYKKLDDKWKFIENIVIENISENETKYIISDIVKKFELSQKEKRLLICYIQTVGDKKILFSHFPLFNNSDFDAKYKKIIKGLEYLYDKYECDLNIHGHSHSYSSNFANSISACVEKTNFKPTQVKELLSNYFRIDKKIILEHPIVFGKPPFDMSKTLIGFGFECSHGWFPTLKKLVLDIEEVVKRDNLKDFKVVQVKEKMGYLSFYTNNGNKEIYSLIRNCESELEHICEKCGRGNASMREICYFQTLCQTCFNKIKKK